MKKVRNSLNFVPDDGKVFTQPSQTVPDQTMSLRTIMTRYASGMPVGGIKEALWDDDAESSLGIDPKKLDLVDVQEMKMDIDEYIKAVKSVKTKTPKAEEELSEEAESTNLT